ncbi:MAG: MiaB/RimO family radical SAM methylthiotransferase [Kiritimatiellia bacterium]|jgi:threonylcarbamoyladenosine tRNA methylthiotransferase MtaB
MTTFSFKTIGCRLNQAETATMCAMIIAAGDRVVEFGKPCDICIIHGCAVTARAEKNTWRLARAAQKTGLARQVAVAGCAAEMAAARRHPPGTALLLRQADKLDLVRLRLALGLPPALTTGHSVMPLPSGTRALVRVQDGCDFRCSYCVVPLTRGAPRSRPLPEIMKEIQHLEGIGCREIVLTGANLGCYNWQGTRLRQLLENIVCNSGIRRVRLSSIEISTAECEVIDCMADNQAICRFLHLPLQSGSDTILKSMRRRYDRRHYIDTVTYAMDKLGTCGLGTDVLVGFPGETDTDFEDTFRLLNDLPFSNLHVFTFSPRPGTPAATMPEQVPAAAVHERAARLRELGAAKRASFARTFVNRPVEVLVEQTPPNATDAAGWTGEYLYARIPPGSMGKIPPNSIVKCRPRSTQNSELLDCDILSSGLPQKNREQLYIISCNQTT